MNTPAYFCFDNFGAEGTEVLPEKNVDVTPTGINEVSSEATGATSVFDLQGRRMAETAKGMNIIRMNDGTFRKVVK
jgi:hypothetical protein